MPRDARRYDSASASPREHQPGENRSTNPCPSFATLAPASRKASASACPPGAGSSGQAGSANMLRTRVRDSACSSAVGSAITRAWFENATHTSRVPASSIQRRAASGRDPPSPGPRSIRPTRLTLRSMPRHRGPASAKATANPATAHAATAPHRRVTPRGFTQGSPNASGTRQRADGSVNTITGSHDLSGRPEHRLDRQQDACRFKQQNRPVRVINR